MSAKIHTVTAKQFKGDMSEAEREGFLASVASEFLAKSGRGKNRKTVVSMPDSYAALYGRRLRQAAKLADRPVTDVEAEVLAKAEVVAAETPPKAPKAVESRKATPKATPKVEAPAAS